MCVNVSSAHPCYLVNNSVYKEVYTDKGYGSYFTGDLIALKPHHPILVTVLRDKEPLRMEFVKDSDRSIVEVRSKLSWVYYLNFATLYPLCGAGFLGDINSPKKWEYDNDVFIDMEHPRYTFTRHSARQPRPQKQESFEPRYAKKEGVAESPGPTKAIFTKRYSSKDVLVDSSDLTKVIFAKENVSNDTSVDSSGISTVIFTKGNHSVEKPERAKLIFIKNSAKHARRKN